MSNFQFYMLLANIWGIHATVAQENMAPFWVIMAVIAMLLGIVGFFIGN